MGLRGDLPSIAALPAVLRCHRRLLWGTCILASRAGRNRACSRVLQGVADEGDRLLYNSCRNIATLILAGERFGDERGPGRAVSPLRPMRGSGLAGHGARFERVEQAAERQDDERMVLPAFHPGE